MLEWSDEGYFVGQDVYVRQRGQQEHDWIRLDEIDLTVFP